MAAASATEVFNCTPAQFYAIISDFEKYPEFLPEVKSASIIEEKNGKKRVQMSIHVVKKFTYSMWMTENPDSSLTWEFAGGDLFKKMSGSWELKEEVGKTRAIYTIEAKFSLFVPGPIAKMIMEVNLPNMMSAYKKRVSELYGG